MTPENIKNKRLFSLFLLGALLFNYPLLSLFNRDVFVWGIPLLYIFLFSIWGFLIIAMIFITKLHPATSLKEKEKPMPLRKRSRAASSPNRGDRC